MEKERVCGSDCLSIVSRVFIFFICECASIFQRRAP
jgi:hypothetical protein